VTKSTLNQEEWIALLRQQGAELPFDVWGGDARLSIFFNPSNHLSMRLTKPGYKFLSEKLKLSNYKFTLPKSITPKVLLLLERHIHYPYYIAHIKNVVIFDEVTAIMLQLHGNDLETYLTNLEAHQ
jgi:hypothetical protein